MRRKLDLAMTLVGNPSIIFLDEPTTGLDPRSRHTMWSIIRGLVADRVAVLDQGRLVAQGTPDELKRQIPGTHIRLRFTTVTELDAAARAFPDATRDDEALALRVPGDGGTKSLRAVLDRLDEHSLSAEECSVHTPDLDDVFLALTGHTAEVAK
jgi:ABC-2 type transport system ATP-binding protein